MTTQDNVLSSSTIKTFNMNPLEKYEPPVQSCDNFEISSQMNKSDSFQKSSPYHNKLHTENIIIKVR